MLLRLRYLRRRRVIVSLKGGRSFAGICWRAGWSLLVLRDAQMLRDRDEPVPLDGEVVLERRDVEFYQVEGG